MADNYSYIDSCMLEETKFKESLNYYDDSALLSYKLYTNAMIIPNEGNWEMGVVEENGYFVDNSHLHNQITKSSISYITPQKTYTFQTINVCI